MSGIKFENNELKRKRLRSQIVVILSMLAIFVICNFIVGGKLLTVYNIKTILSHATYPAIIALGMLFIFSSGLIDLSIGATIILAANLAAAAVGDFGLGYPGLILIAIAVTVVCELLSVGCSVFLGIPSWIAGLGMALTYEALCAIFTTARSKTAGTFLIHLKECRALGKEPLIYIITAAAFIIAYIFYQHSTLGFNIQAIGGSDSVAQAMGIKRKKNIMTGAFVGAVFIGIAAIVQLSYSGKITSRTGLGSLPVIFDSLAIRLLSRSLAGIFSEPVGIILCSIIIRGLFNVLTLMGVPTGTGQEICLGVTVILCGILANRKNKEVVK